MSTTNFITEFGSREQVWAGIAKKTKGGLRKDDLTENKYGKIVSLKQSERAKIHSNLAPKGYLYAERGGPCPLPPGLPGPNTGPPKKPKKPQKSKGKAPSPVPLPFSPGGPFGGLSPLLSPSFDLSIPYLPIHTMPAPAPTVPAPVPIYFPPSIPIPSKKIMPHSPIPSEDSSSSGSSSSESEKSSPKGAVRRSSRVQAPKKSSPVQKKKSSPVQKKKSSPTSLRRSSRVKKPVKK